MRTIKLSQVIRLLVLFFFLNALPGCNHGDGVPLGRVSGVVTLDGEPLSQASVSFHPESGRGSFGTTDLNGQYELKYIKEMGATLGAHKVTITSQVWDSTTRKLEPGQRAQAAAESATGSRPEILPEIYRFKETTVLSADVQSGENTFDFDLKSVDVE